MRVSEIVLISAIVIVSICNICWITIFLLIMGARYVLYLQLEERIVVGVKLNAYLTFVSSRVIKLGGREWCYTTNHKKLGILYI